MSQKGYFITFEGIDGCGKSTQARLLATALKRLGHNVVLTREPGGTPLGRKLRQILLHTDSHVSPKAELFLYLADRTQHIEEVIAPALAAGKIVISERFDDSTRAYQGAGRKLSNNLVEVLNQAAVNNIKPDITFLLDISPKTARERMQKDNKIADRFERLQLDFHLRLARAFRALAKAEPARFRVINAALGADKIHAQVLKALDQVNLLLKG